MFLDIEVPILRKVEFILSSSLTYFFDVNQNITILSLKKILSSAARLRKHSFRIYNNNIDYTEYDSSSLVTLFPTQQHIIFTIQKIEDESLFQDDTIMKININLYCKEHESKYLSYYCYTCNQSICSKCIFDNKHKGHQYMEKTDYLQNSKILVDNAFKSNRLLNNSPELLLSKQHYISSIFGHSLESVLFKPINDIIKEIEKKLNDLVKCYNKVTKDSFEIFNNNALLSKEYCIQGIDVLKEAINIADIVIDENVFLSFDNKYRNLLNETEKKIKDDIEKFRILNNDISISIEQYIQKEYNDILNYLQNKLNNIQVSSFTNKINNCIISELTQKEVIDSLIEDINLSISFNSANNNQIRISSFLNKNNENMLKNIKNSETNFYIPNKDISYIMSPLQESNVIKVYNIDNSYKSKTVSFPQILNTNIFYKGSAYCNYNGRLYISGGFIDKDESLSSNALLSYEYNSNSLMYISGMKTSHSNHSMIGYSDYIYVIGGIRNKNCESYNINTKQCLMIPSLHNEHVFPILAISNNMLYVIFGKSNMMNNVIEVINLNELMYWEKITFSNVDNVSTDVYGSGVVSIDNDLICFGGVQQGFVTNKYFILKLDEKVLLKGKEELEYVEYFNENQLFRMNEKYVQISAKGNGLIWVVIDV